MRSNPVAVGVDLGGTHLRVSAVSAEGRILANRVLPSPSADGPEAVGTTVVAQVRDVASQVGRDLPIGVGVASLVDREGRLVSAPNLDVDGCPLKERLTEALHVPVTVVNDATAACFGEMQAGAARSHSDVLLLTIGTGVGGGVVVGGRLLCGHLGMAGEVGHMVIANGGRPCGCGKQGCLEAYVSGPAMAAYASQLLADGRVSEELAREPLIDGAALCRALQAGDQLALEVVQEAGRWLGIGLANLINAFDPSVVVLGGGAGTGLHQWLLPTARATAARQVTGHPRRPLPRMIPASLGDNAGVVGSAMIAWEDARGRPQADPLASIHRSGLRWWA